MGAFFKKTKFLNRFINTIRNNENNIKKSI